MSGSSFLMYGGLAASRTKVGGTYLFHDSTLDVPL
jgi:hypothetical protein